MERADIMILFHAGNYDKDTPGTFHIELREYFGTSPVIILEIKINVDGETSTKSTILETTEAEAIITAVNMYQNLANRNRCSSCMFWKQNEVDVNWGYCQNEDISEYTNGHNFKSHSHFHCDFYRSQFDGLVDFYIPGSEL